MKVSKTVGGVATLISLNLLDKFSVRIRTDTPAIKGNIYLKKLDEPDLTK